MTGGILSRSTEPWAIQAARNVMGLLPFLVEPGEDTPVIRIEDLADRIQKAFPNRKEWNKAISESQQLAPEEKLWLVVVVTGRKDQ